MTVHMLAWPNYLCLCDNNAKKHKFNLWTVSIYMTSITFLVRGSTRLNTLRAINKVIMLTALKKDIISFSFYSHFYSICFVWIWNFAGDLSCWYLLLLHFQHQCDICMVLHMRSSVRKPQVQKNEKNFLQKTEQHSMKTQDSFFVQLSSLGHNRNKCDDDWCPITFVCKQFFAQLFFK